MQQHIRKRNKLEIIAIILKSASANGDQGEIKTHLLYRSSLSSKELGMYVKMLIGHGLLDYDSESRRFKANMKTARYLDLYYRMKQADLTGWLDE